MRVGGTLNSSSRLEAGNPVHFRVPDGAIIPYTGASYDGVYHTHLGEISLIDISTVESVPVPKMVGVRNISPRAFPRRIVRCWHPLGCRAIELGNNAPGGRDIRRRSRVDICLFSPFFPSVVFCDHMTAGSIYLYEVHAGKTKHIFQHEAWDLWGAKVTGETF